MTVTMGTLNTAIKAAQGLVIHTTSFDAAMDAQQIVRVLQQVRQDRIDRVNASMRDILDFADREPDLWRILVHTHQETASHLRALLER